jgi:hypothetical protein
MIWLAAPGEEQQAGRHDRAGVIEVYACCRVQLVTFLRFPVTVTQLPVTRCQICHCTVAYRPGKLAEVLTEHYRRAHPEALELVSG